MRTIFSLIALLLTLNANAGTLVGTVQSILLLKNYPNVAFVYINSTTAGGPSCAGFNMRMSLDITTASGKLILLNISAMKLANPDAVVTLHGTNACELWPDTESVDYVYLYGSN